jgi:hypothetical protein
MAFLTRKAGGVMPGDARSSPTQLLLRIPGRRDGLHWPHRDGLKWPHPPSGFLSFD